jgi:hypothetical protein
MYIYTYRVSNGSSFSRQAGLGRSRRVSALSDNNREKENEDVYFNTSDDDDDDNNRFHIHIYI